MPGMLVRPFISPPSAQIGAPGQRTNRRISTQKATERRCPMKPWLQRSAVSAVVLAFLPLIELASPAVSRAQPPPPPCPLGMYWNFDRVVCEIRHLRPCTSIRGCRFGSRISSMSTSMSISQFPALQVSALQVSGLQGDRISAVLAQHPDHLPPQAWRWPWWRATRSVLDQLRPRSRACPNGV